MEENQDNNNLLHKFPNENNLQEKEDNEFFTFKASAVIFIMSIVLGIISGYGIRMIYRTLNTSKGNNTVAESSAQAEEAVGIPDKKTFKDSAEGVLQEGGIDGEGSFHLKRPGGESQNVYLTSSAVDLSEFIGKKVRVHGETFSAQKAGWLMDVGFVEVLK